jgi:hypothetical protein
MCIRRTPQKLSLKEKISIALKTQIRADAANANKCLRLVKNFS